MADKTFDAVIVGGGNKGLLLALYLIKFGGMSVGVFERRHEIGGCLATEELSAPGFRGNTHANQIFPFYYAPIYRDFPEFWDYGARWEQHLCSDGFVFKDKENCLAIYSVKHDPTQERTAREIARFSQTDADLWVKLWNIHNSDDYQRMTADMLFKPAEDRMTGEVMERQAMVLPKMMELGWFPDTLTMNASGLRAVRERFESQELQSCILRQAISSVVDINEPGYGMRTLGLAPILPLIGFNRGGTHQIAHAAHQILTQSGCKFFTNQHVDKAIIQNGRATGIRLADGSEVAARKIVVSTLSPSQLIFELIGEAHVDAILKRRVQLIQDTFGCLMWYQFAVHEAPKYKAEAFNPDIHETLWLGMQPDPDPMHQARECHYQKLRKFPPMDDYAPTVGCHSLVDPSFAPPGKHVVYNEQLAPAATTFTEKQWLEIKKRYADELIALWQDYAPNMTWDNVIGVDTNSAYDHRRMRNLGPNGTMAGIDRSPFQIEENRPTPELANHRTPIANLYATGGSWHVGSNAGSTEAYNCYRIIAKDLGLDKPWEQAGKEEPDSLVEQIRWVQKRVQDSV
ncbi:MAG: NAD(P)/FAD-dependent oxidoreductase [Candidatus Binatia bacterium]